MTLAEMTALMSRVGRANPTIMQDRSVTLFVQACIDEAKRVEADEAVPRTSHDLPLVIPLAERQVHRCQPQSG